MNSVAKPTAGTEGSYAATSAETLTVLAKNELKERIWATPALVEHTIYARADRHLFAFSTQSGTGATTAP